MKHTYAVLDGDRLVCAHSRIANARKRRAGISGRRIVRLDPAGETIELRDYRGGRYTIRGTEVA